MTQVGHTLIGIAIGVACIPEKKSAQSRIIHLVVFGILANIPDFPFKYWGHDRYYISHSLFVNLLLIFIFSAAFVFLQDIRASIGGWPVIISGIFAWLSHLLLDTFYNHGKGLLMFWPLSDKRLALPIPWFSVVKDMPPPFTPDILHIFLIELAFYGSILLIVIWFKRVRLFDWISRHIFQKSN